MQGFIRHQRARVDVSLLDRDQIGRLDRLGHSDNDGHREARRLAGRDLGRPPRQRGRLTQGDSPLLEPARRHQGPKADRLRPMDQGRVGGQ